MKAANSNRLQHIFDRAFHILLSDRTKEKSERIILVIAIISFVAHLGLIYLQELEVFLISADSELLKNPIAAIYTPFSFILIYEVYLLVYYLPKSITTYIGKQYEIITLIIIRRLFKDLSNLKLSADWFQIKDDLQFTYDILATLLLFYLIFIFGKYSPKNHLTEKSEQELSKSVHRFVKLKKNVATLLVPILLVLAIYTFGSWGIGLIDASYQTAINFKDINNIFFDEFFTVLIIVDVILLLNSFFITDQFHKVIRNSGFVISTILIRLSFSVGGLVNKVLIVSAVVFGLLILMTHNQYEKENQDFSI